MGVRETDGRGLVPRVFGIKDHGGGREHGRKHGAAAAVNGGIASLIISSVRTSSVVTRPHPCLPSASPLLAACDSSRSSLLHPGF
eukprot:543167-Hanusia_phi.AAC.4